MLIKDYMRTNVATIPVDVTFREALERLLDDQTNGMIVTKSETDLEPVGVLTSFHLVKAVVPAHLHAKADLAQFAGGNQFEEWVQDAEHTPLKDIMQPLPHERWLHEDDTMEKAVAFSAQDNLLYIPVVNRPDHKMIGLISRTDIKKAMAHIIGREF
ncbi:MAG: CBS domain-containing protein [Candidatus Doudnabacteria bacterium]|nr:CBS domain-containing protein [Candidatus Doudnabacteria bacterium]MCA9387862.1 CBS domain-containing protein [Candidatus Andersenbacteria bacterium]